MRAILLLAALTLWLVGARPVAAAPVPVRVCAEDRDWPRPDAAEMARTVWRDNRYVDGSGLPHAYTLAYYRHHFFFFTTPSASGADHTLDMSGLKTAHPPDLCDAAGASLAAGPYDLAAGRTVAVWTIGYHVLAADRTAGTLTLTVEPNATPERGYAIVEVARPTAAAWTARAVLADGREVARLADPLGQILADEPGLPPLPTALPRTGGPPVPRAPLSAVVGLALVAVGGGLRRRR